MDEYAQRIAAIAVALSDLGILPDICEAILNGRLTRTSSSACHSVVAQGGSLAQSIADHFEMMMSKGILKPYESQR